MTTEGLHPCSREAARAAVMRWHYSKRMPNFRLVTFGWWEGGRFCGAVIFGRGATPEIGSPYRLEQTQVCELCRVALGDHATPTSAVVAAALRELRRTSPGVELVVSFADEDQGHVGTIYQATNWLYLGTSVTHAYRVRGRIVHPKTLHSQYGIGGQSIPWLREHVDPAAERVILPPKHRYVFPFSRSLRRRLLPLAQPYPRSKAQREPSGVLPEGASSILADRSAV